MGAVGDWRLFWVLIAGFREYFINVVFKDPILVSIIAGLGISALIAAGRLIYQLVVLRCFVALPMLPQAAGNEFKNPFLRVLRREIGFTGRAPL